MNMVQVAVILNVSLLVSFQKISTITRVLDMHRPLRDLPEDLCYEAAETLGFISDEIDLSKRNYL